MTHSRTRIEVSYNSAMPEGRQLSFRNLSTEGRVHCGEDGAISVPPGDHSIRFERSTLIVPPEWAFCGFRYKPGSSTESFGPISSIEIGEDYVEIVDLNRNETGLPQRFTYELQLLDSSGASTWVDPVIENKSGSNPPPDSE